MDADRLVFSLDEAIAAAPDVAFVCGPTSLHAEHCISMFGAGAHVFVEKPVALDVQSAKRIVVAAKMADRDLIVGYNLRFLPSLQALKHALELQQIGRPLSARAEVGQYLPDWRPGVDYRTSNSARALLGGGIELELSHEIDYISWLLGDAETVNASFAHGSDLEIEGDDTAEIILQMRSGVLASVHMDMTQRSPTRTCRIVGADGTLLWDGLTGTVMKYLPGTGWSTICEDDGSRNEMYLKEIQHVFACVRHETTPIVTYAEAIRTVQIANAARISSNNGQRVSL